MQDSSSLDQLRRAIQQALLAQDELLKIWEQTDINAVAPQLTSDDLDLLKQLVIRRIYPANAFEYIVRLDRPAAVELLLSRYVGECVDPDSKFGGYLFELSIMLDDMRATYGDQALIELVQDPRFCQEMLSERRVLKAFSEALDISMKECELWLLRIRSGRLGDE
jgi:hypothetical protein